MPKINGKFYANPAYGRTVERARAQERQKQVASRPRPASGRKAHHGKDDYDPATTPSGIANQIYNETSGLRATAQQGPGSDLDFQAARIAMAHVIQNRAVSKIHGGLAADQLRQNEARSIKIFGSAAYDAYGASRHAAELSQSKKDPTEGADHFYLDSGQPPPPWTRGRKPVQLFGPFRNTTDKGEEKHVRIPLYRLGK